MNDAPDSELLAQFARNDSEAAFAVLVQRYIALVHSVALRHTANTQHAQDITQAVFIILARKAGGAWTQACFDRLALSNSTTDSGKLFKDRNPPSEA